MDEKILVSKWAVKQLLQALLGPSHLIHELMVTRNLPGDSNAIDQLLKDYKASENTNVLHPASTSQDDSSGG